MPMLNGQWSKGDTKGGAFLGIFLFSCMFIAFGIVMAAAISLIQRNTLGTVDRATDPHIGEALDQMAEDDTRVITYEGKNYIIYRTINGHVVAMRPSIFWSGNPDIDGSNQLAPVDGESRGPTPAMIKKAESE